ncbi:MAG TPA: glycosyltransferase family 2 protein [Methylomirabilota bacterium]|nr:glycosyltransferase family 2 protein [Methylomirabilota bacterium]
MTTPPSISVVIPTRARPDLVTRAVASALAQTVGDLEVIVVVDGPDATTVRAVEAIDDARIRVIVADPPLGAGEARNRGVAAARGVWVAFLDDDDSWLPAKLERQLAVLHAATIDQPIAFCPIVIRSAAGDRAWRSRPPRSGEPASEYLFVRRSLRTGEGTVGTSTIVARRSLLEAIRFDPSVRRFQDADWILRAASTGAELLYCPERLSIWAAPDDRRTITADHAADWTYAFDWICERRHLVTARAYAAFLLVRVAGLAAAAGDRSAIGVLWREARRAGRPGILDVVLFVGRWLVPDGVRTRLRHRLVGVGDMRGGG